MIIVFAKSIGNNSGLKAKKTLSIDLNRTLHIDGVLSYTKLMPILLIVGGYFNTAELQKSNMLIFKGNGVFIVSFKYSKGLKYVICEAAVHYVIFLTKGL